MKSKAGRKNKYETHVKPYLSKIKEWASEATERDIAKNLGVAVSSFMDYKNKYPELQQALIEGQRNLIMDLKSALILSAKGLNVVEEKTITESANGDKPSIQLKTKQLPINVGAAVFLLKNLDKENWSDNPHNKELKEKELELKKMLAEYQMNDW